MSIYTPKMRQHYDANLAPGSNWKFWLPGNDASGTTMTDAIGDVVITDASAAHAEPHSVTFGHASGAPTTGTLPILQENFLLVISQKVATTESFLFAKLGTATVVQVTNSVALCDYDAGDPPATTTSLTGLGSVNGDVVTTAAAVIGDTLYHYGSINDAGITENATADASAFTAQFSQGNPTLNNIVALSSVAVRQHIYGVAFATFGKGAFTTTEIITALDEIDGNWPIGRKYLPRSIY